LDISLLDGAERVHAIEWTWWERFRDARIFLYQLPADSFEIADVEAGYYIARSPVRPIGRTLITDVVQKHADLGIELRVVENLWPAPGMSSAACDLERGEESGTAEAD